MSSGGGVFGVGVLGGTLQAYVPLGTKRTKL